MAIRARFLRPGDCAFGRKAKTPTLALATEGRKRAASKATTAERTQEPGAQDEMQKDQP